MEPVSSQLRDDVREAYSKAALEPSQPHPFPVGREFARSLGYADELLDQIPRTSVDSFAGVSNVSVFAGISAGDLVLDLGCGAGLDSLVAAWRVGPEGRVVGVDFSDAMLRNARSSLGQLELRNLMFVRASAEGLPLADASADQVLVNGIFNLNPYRQQIFAELGRVVRSGGSVFGAELVLRAPLEDGARTGTANWFS